MQLFLLPLALGQSLVLGQLTQETVGSQEENNPKENLEVGGAKVYQVPAESSDEHAVEKILPGIGTALKVNLTPGFANGGIITQESLSSSVNSGLLGSEHPANQPTEYFTAAEFSREPSSAAAQFPRTLGLTQILGREQVLTHGGESDPAQDLTQGNPQSDYLTAVEYLQPQVVTTMACQMVIMANRVIIVMMNANECFRQQLMGVSPTIHQLQQRMALISTKTKASSWITTTATNSTTTMLALTTTTTTTPLTIHW